MRRLKRINNIVEEIATAEHNKDEYLPKSQASYNSDGVITIRNYDNSNKSKDEIIILSLQETGALFELFSKICLNVKNHTLPF